MFWKLEMSKLSQLQKRETQPSAYSNRTLQPPNPGRKIEALTKWISPCAYVATLLNLNFDPESGKRLKLWRIWFSRSLLCLFETQSFRFRFDSMWFTKWVFLSGYVKMLVTHWIPALKMLRNICPSLQSYLVWSHSGSLAHNWCRSLSQYFFVSKKQH